MGLFTAFVPGMMPAFAQGAGGKKVEGQKFIFDAKRQRFEYTGVRPPASLSAAKPVTIIVRNINTFREKYDIKAKLEERHNLGVPNALASLIQSKEPTTTTFGGASRITILERKIPEAIMNADLKKSNGVQNSVRERGVVSDWTMASRRGG